MKKTLGSAGGQAMVEFALVIPLMVLVMMGIFDLGQSIYAFNLVANAAREGARFGILDPTNTIGVQAHVTAVTAGLDPTRLQTPVVECSDDGTTFNAICNGNRTFMRVSVTYVYQPVTSFFGSTSLVGTSMMAIEP